MPSNASQRSRSWCFTRNNYTDDHIMRLHELFGGGHVEFLVVGREVGDNGTPHLQGFVMFRTRRVFGVVQNMLPHGCHLEVARGTPQQNFDYCTKEDIDPIVFGTLPQPTPGKRTDIESFYEWCKVQVGPPSEKVVMDQFPSLYLRYRGNLLKMSSLLCARPPVPEVTLRDWQEDLQEVLVEYEPDDRKVLFYVDEAGNSGKSWMARYLYRKMDGVQILKVGKRDDLAHAIDESNRIFIFDIPRGGMEYLQYGILEMLKDQMVFSPKYNSRAKLFNHPVHVIVFCNEYPDLNAMTGDRFVIHQL